MIGPRKYTEEAFNLQKDRHKEQLRQVRITFYVVLGLFIVSIAIVCFGVFILDVKNLSGIITAGAGTFLGALSGIMLKFNSDAHNRLHLEGQELDARASFNDGIRESERIIDKIPDPGMKSKELAALAKDIRKGPPKIIQNAQATQQNQISPGYIRTFIRKLF